MAVTPATITNIPPGTYPLILRLAGYNDYSTTVTIVAGQTTSTGIIQLISAYTPVSSCSISGCSDCTQGDTLYIQPSWSGGNAPFSVQVLKDGIEYGNPISAPNRNIGQLMVPTDTSWTPGTHQLSVRITDSYSSPSSCTTPACTINVYSASILSTINLSGCGSPITVGSTCTVSTSCYDQFGAAISCGTLTWQSSNSAVASVNSSGIVTALASGTANITARNASGTVISNSITVTVQAPIPTICSWIVLPMTANNISILISAYLGYQSLGFVVTASYISGAISYYLGYTASGNASTGCSK